MKTVTGNELGAQPALRDDLTAPTPGTNEVLARGLACSVNPVDDGIAAAIAEDMVPHEFPVLTSTLGAPAVLLARQRRRRRHQAHAPPPGAVELEPLRSTA